MTQYEISSLWIIYKGHTLCVIVYGEFITLPYLRISHAYRMLPCDNYKFATKFFIQILYYTLE